MKGNTVRVINTHLQSPLILKKKQHQWQISHWLGLKGKKKREKELRKGGEKGDTKEMGLNVIIKE